MDLGGDFSVLVLITADMLERTPVYSSFGLGIFSLLLLVSFLGLRVIFLDSFVRDFSFDFSFSLEEDLTDIAFLLDLLLFFPSDITDFSLG